MVRNTDIFKFLQNFEKKNFRPNETWCIPACCRRNYSLNKACKQKDIYKTRNLWIALRENSPQYILKNRSKIWDRNGSSFFFKNYLSQAAVYGKKALNNFILVKSKFGSRWLVDLAAGKKIFAHIFFSTWSCKQGSAISKFIYTQNSASSVNAQSFFWWVLKMDLFADCFSVALIIITIHSAESGTCEKTNVCPAIQAMETKLEKIISLLSPPGKIEWTDFHNVGSFIRCCFFSLFLFFYIERVTWV